ncbi:MAG: DNA/RNA non-specific endonuclease [Burkholderiales bacterium]
MAQGRTVRFEDMEWLGGKPATSRQPVAEAADLERVRVQEIRIHAASHFKGRKGFDPAFISGFRVPLPRVIGALKGDEAPLVSGSGHVLHYTHFSSVLSKSRRVPLYTACNIDGRASVKVPRGNKDVWFYDGRIAIEHQVGEDLYEGNILDRGHLVRREDPVWGVSAKLANDDTFHFTNCAPQASAMNQKTWLGLEDYILQNARAHDLKISVFTGPVFRADDTVYRGVRIPKEYWKVVAIRTPERPSVTAYLLSQAKLLADLEFVFGKYKTYQVAIKEVETLTGLDFGGLSQYDGFSNSAVRESARWPRAELKDWKAIRI